MSEQTSYNTLLTVKLAGEAFALDAMKVGHILEVPEITEVPNAPDFMKGIFNLHGNILPVVDLRMMMGFEHVEYSADTAIVVINPDGHQESNLGVVVDLVKEVVEADGIEVKPTVVDNDRGMLTNFQGTFSMDGEFVHIIDTDELASAAEL
ncbi:MAG: chemotaxis protein CheW [Bacteroidota bacterium]